MDTNFLPKKLANNNSNYVESNNKLKKKNEQLKTLMKELDSDEEINEPKRVSKISQRSYIGKKPLIKSEDVYFFLILFFL